MPIFNPKTVTNFLTYEKEEKVGFLWKKRSEQKKSYKKRYFMLCGNILAYFDKKLDKEPLGIIFLDCHIVEMLDDLKMAIRFRGPGELSRSYILKGESAEDIEDWMRAISRCSIEYITLTLEDLEDHYRALTTVKQNNTNFKVSSSESNGITNSSIKSSIFSKRSNPFNKSNSVITGYDMLNSTLLNSQSHKSSSSNNLPYSITSSSSINHTQWLLTHNWEQLHDYLKAQFIKSDNTTNIKLN
ncbi:Sesquipedalian-1 [Schistosoma japonicum]|uniref:SJCHGC01943 protein n=1 Tax=Schistosoma japonicum TaxID=6182 RepID=Q5DC01_SCHJA|nr:SJCHGC01943 protein [Schistosoma japonicum]KAH8857815.1 Sesquipedalian-1 [Schistosoma japonicum]KAH8857816.1 Sesquipedalian-1 [Schistosoma japonicum]KAH8857817.1 Sesquipedalian-1 [Schistosoma japonicum]KAH8857818.1 Sesquipedalian-1 [Schistosoma japonicum]